MAEGDAVKNRVDAKHMRRALELAGKAEGFTSPNPMVGAVVVKDGKIVGEGYHKKAGGPHAEVHALAAAGQQARDADVYVTLEPCSHYGRTPPCAEALINAAPRRVVVAMQDPNPRVSGRGISLLRAAGIDVEVGVLEQEAKQLNRAFIKHITTGKPLVVAKMAMSIDGKIASRTGSSQWITGQHARQSGRALRHHYDAILVGINTVVADNPRLTVRTSGRETINPLRVVLDSQLRIPIDSNVLNVKEAPTWVVTTQQGDQDKREYLEKLGVNVLVQQGHTRVNLEQLLIELGRHQITGLVVEGGGVVHGSFFDQDLVDLIYLYMGYKVIGGADAPGPVGGRGISDVNQAQRFKLVEVHHFSEDLGLLLERDTNGG